MEGREVMAGIKMRTLDPAVRAAIYGAMIGDIWFVNGDAGDDNASGESQDEAIRTVNQGVRKLVDGHHDHLLLFGAETQVASTAIAVADAHLIGIGNGGMANEYARGFTWTCMATNDSIQPAATADGLEIAGIEFVQNATDHILIDDAGATGCFFHHNTVFGSTTASDAIRLDIEGDKWTITDNSIWRCLLAIDLAAAQCVVARNHIQCEQASAKGVVIGASAHHSQVKHNLFDLGAASGEIGITVASSADYCVLAHNGFASGCADPINDSGTSTMKIGNYSAAITGTSTTSLLLYVDN